MANIRELCLELLLAVEKGEDFDHLLIRRVLDKYDYFPKQEKAFLQRLTEGCIERKIELLYLIDQVSKVKTSDMKPVIRNILSMGVYQIYYMDSVPDSAACNEAVILAKKKGFRTLSGFVNGVLRSIARQKGKIPYPDKEKDWKKALSVSASFPLFLIDLWDRDYGKEKTLKMAEASLSIPPVSVRVSEDCDKKELEKRWEEKGIAHQVHPYLPYAYTLSDLEQVTAIPGFKEGKVNVMDVSSMFVGECAGIQPGDCVLDVCAAPGGKSLHALSKLNGRGQVISGDVSERKLVLLQDNLERSGYSNFETVLWDATLTNPDWEGIADVLYLDVPCSGLGILGKKRDLKYRITKEALKELDVLQKKILSASIPYVKRGGTVIYSTCTVHRAENEEMTEWLEKEFGLKRESVNPFIPKCLQNENTRKGMLAFFPGEHLCDGFFICRFRKE